MDGMTDKKRFSDANSFRYCYFSVVAITLNNDDDFPHETFTTLSFMKMGDATGTSSS